MIDQLTNLIGYAVEVVDAVETRSSVSALGWSGQAAWEYEQHHRRQIEGLTRMVEGARTMRAAGRTAHESYSDAVETCRRILGV